ncbi:MAG: hypothetical protein HRF45_05355 [Fimbriimonadia bacterium]|jgi:Spy/CpxP family protein refolding chaperone
MKPVMRLVALIAAAVLVSVVFAQNPGARQGRGQFGGGQIGAGQFGGAMQLLSMLRMPDVQAELKLTEAQKTKLEALNVRPQAGQGPPTQEERQARAAQVEKEIQTILDKAQYERLKQLSLQLRGPDALASDPELQKALGLTEDQIKKISDTVAQVRQSHMQQFRGGAGGEQPDREQMMARMQEMRKEMATKVEALLTAEQKAKYQALKGKAFTFTNPWGGFGGRQRGGPGGQPGGPPGRGDGGF